MVHALPRAFHDHGLYPDVRGYSLAKVVPYSNEKLNAKRVWLLYSYKRIIDHFGSLDP